MKASDAPRLTWMRDDLRICHSAFARFADDERLVARRCSGESPGTPAFCEQPAGVFDALSQRSSRCFNHVVLAVELSIRERTVRIRNKLEERPFSEVDANEHPSWFVDDVWLVAAR